MSQSVQDVLSAITVASEALTREPQLRSQIADLEQTLAKSQTHAQELELKGIDYKSQIDALNEKVRSLEVERDAAQFRTIELEDLIHNSLKAIRTASHRLDEAISDLDPPKPEPIVGEAVSDVGPEPTSSPTPSETGQSVKDPTPPQEPFSPTSGGETTGPASDKPYAGKKWSETWKPDGTRIWSREEWFAGGGTEETYNQ